MPKAGSVAKGQLAVYGEDLENLRASGLTDETIRANLLRTECDSVTLAGILNWTAGSLSCAGGLVIPYRNLAGKVNCFARVRPHRPRIQDGKPIKYEQPVGEPPRAYFPASSLPLLRDGGSAVFVTEGEKKALALSQLRPGLAAVGLGGIWCWKVKGPDRLIPDLAEIPLAGRTVYIVFDFDAAPETRDTTAFAARRFAQALRRAGSGEIRAVELPPGPGGAKQGVDDFLVAHSAPAFLELVRLAKAVPAFDKLHPITKAEGRTDASNASRLVAACGEDIRWVGPWDQWLLWDGTRWKRDQCLAIERRAKHVAAATSPNTCSAAVCVNAGSRGPGPTRPSAGGRDYGCTRLPSWKKP